MGARLDHFQIFYFDFLPFFPLSVIKMDANIYVQSVQACDC